jgi:hypothetical protein
MMSWDVTAQQQFFVSMAPRMQQQAPVYMPPDTQAVKVCCCINRGSMTLGAMLDTALTTRNDQLNLSFACKNDSTTALVGVDCVITENINWSAGGHRAAATRVVARQHFDPSSVGGTERLKQKNKNVSADSVSEAAMRDVFNQLQGGGAQSSTLVMAADARDSYNGQIVRCCHYLQVCLQTGCCITNPEVHTPVFVGPPQMPVVQAHAVAVVVLPERDASMQPSAPPVMPADWNSAKVSAPYQVPMAHAILGGTAEAGPDGEEYSPPPPMYGASTAASASAPSVPQGSLAELHVSLDATFDDIGAIRRFIEAPESEFVLHTLTPADFAQIVAKVGLSFDQPLAAVLLADQLGAAMSCAHLAAAIHTASSLARTDLVNKVAPLCHDLSTNSAAIKSTLSPFELMVCERTLN